MTKQTTDMPTHAEMVNLYKKGKANLINYRSLMLVNDKALEIDPAPFHYQWSDRLINGTENEAIEGFRESAKTQYVLRSFLLYCFTYPSTKRDFIAIIKNNATLASAKLKEIEDELKTNPIISCNVVKVKEASGRVLSVDVKDHNGKIINIRIEAYGKGSSIRGLANKDRRPKVVIADDLQDLEDMQSDVVPDKDWKWFLSDLWFLGKSTRVFMIANNLGAKCIIERIFDNAEELGFKCSRVPEINEEGKANWPANRSAEEALVEKEKFRKIGQLDVWLREKMCISVAEESRTFKKEDMRYYVAAIAEKIAQSCNIFITIDTASSKQLKACLRAIVINGIDKDGKWFVLDVKYGRWDSSEFMDQLFDAVKKWNPISIGIEKGMYKQVIEPFIYKEMSRKKCFFDIKPMEHGKVGSKEERIKMMGPRFKAHMVWFPDRADWLAEMETELLGVTKEGFKSMFVDLIDALAMQMQIEEAPFESGDMDTKDLPRNYLDNKVDESKLPRSYA